MPREEWPDDRSDSTVEETLLMLNLPQLNDDDNKLKHLNIYRKKKGERTVIEKQNYLTMQGGFDKENSSNDTSESSISGSNTNELKIDLTNEEEHMESYGQCSDHGTRQTCEGEKKEDNEDVIVTGEQTLKQNKNERNCIKKKNTQESRERKESKDEVDNIPFEIHSISLKNLFDECPECVINKKYKFRGIHTSSIGTNLYFKEPESLKNKNVRTNYEVSYDNLTKNIKEKKEKKITRDDFASYAGYSTKIVSFEIDY
ncbi:conserved Plasmodium protein, unknown function [Plasmodium ovale]|uniref:Uncharacterized protein n=2 Tax=Plasmodium ovale TaxID=36330 RepID=A0A1A8WWI4_PLAOA|nr:conserved Plasmodium protein, unknown function [Plasmodium ovale curtisi]SBS96251.1 conserved Plasmodium protein, unknown function [Plasmodium ovale curtisi]SCP05388.1 conserved Plasmodium protein, unknown function [Plasmodium ovale]